MTIRAQAVALPIRVKLAGEWYSAAIWDQKDFAEWEEWVKEKYRIDAFAGLSSEERASILMEVQERAAKISFTSTQSSAYMASPLGFIKVWFLGLRKYHPALTEEKVGELLLHRDTDYKELAKFKLVGLGSKKRTTKKKTRRKK